MDMTINPCLNTYTGDEGTQCTFSERTWSEFSEVMEFVTAIAQNCGDHEVHWWVFGQMGSQDFFGKQDETHLIKLQVQFFDRDDLVALMKLRFYKTYQDQ